MSASTATAERTHCVHGHDLRVVGIYWRKNSGGVYGVYRQCQRESGRRSEQRRPEGKRERASVVDEEIRVQRIMNLIDEHAKESCERRRRQIQACIKMLERQQGAA